VTLGFSPDEHPKAFTTFLKHPWNIGTCRKSGRQMSELGQTFLNQTEGIGCDVEDFVPFAMLWLSSTLENEGVSQVPSAAKPLLLF
jgi:hypothetical protein